MVQPANTLPLVVVAVPSASGCASKLPLPVQVARAGPLVSKLTHSGALKSERLPAMSMARAKNARVPSA